MLAEAVLPALAARRVTVDQLERVLAAERGKPDAKAADRVFTLELAERLSTAKLSHWEAEMPGPESRRALLVLADLSAFLEPPRAEIPPAAAPDLSAQRGMMAKAVNYVANAMHQFPNFMATRDTIHFEDSPARQAASDRDLGGTFMPYQRLHPVGRSSATVLYSEGEEVMDTSAAMKPGNSAPGLTTSGEFGPILGTVLIDAAKGKIEWGHWEQGASGQLAVFRFEIPREKSHYKVKFCCVLSGKGSQVFEQFSGYHGEIAIDPVTGAVFRISLIADLSKSDPLSRSDILVEYGSVEIGERSYICPIKSISISRAPAQALRVSGTDWPGDAFEEQETEKTALPLQLMLNEVAFAEYHVFRSEVRLLSGNVATSGNSSLPAAAVANSAAPAQDATKPEEPPAGNESADSAPANTISAAGTTEDAADARPPAAAAAPMGAEISNSAMASLPDIPAPGDTADDAFTLHVVTRLVDVDLVALDKKGRPVDDLKAEDFEISDNGRRQSIRFFSAPNGASPPQSGTAVDESAGSPEQPVFSNHRAEAGDSANTGGVAKNRATILLIDPSSLAWADLTHAREQMLKFLRTLPTGERVGLYVLSARGFQVLVEATADRASLISALHSWIPSARDLAQAQEEEQRNRQQFDEVLHPSDLANVNGNDAAASSLAETMVDPNLQQFSSDPGRAAFLILVGVARHLAAIPGHKNLIWVASNNALADWSDAVVGADKSVHQNGGVILRAQEALNDAQVSIYPLDASQLESMAVDPGLANDSVQLSPSVTTGPQTQEGAQPAGRLSAGLQQDLRPVKTSIQQMANATGGRVVPRSGDLVANLMRVVEDGRATYLFGFSPDTPADDRYHTLTAKIATRRGVTLRFRSGYFYAKEPATLKDRFREAIWQPLDANEIQLVARPQQASAGAALRLNISAADLRLKQQGDVWTDKLDIFLVQRADPGVSAHVTGQTLVLRLKPDTFHRILGQGIPFDQFVAKDEDAGSLRIVVVDENSGRMGSVTLPAAALATKE
jgi:VWFA-related protein